MAVQNSIDCLQKALEDYEEYALKKQQEEWFKNLITGEKGEIKMKELKLKTIPNLKLKDIDEERATDIANENPTTSQSEAIVKVYDYFNTHLFNYELGGAMIVFNRSHQIIGGYYSPQKWLSVDGDKVDEIAINANVMVQGEEIEIFQILIHEMLHKWQHDFGTPGRGGYHNREWADKATQMGLRSINVTNPSQDTGDSISTSLIQDGKATQVIAMMPEEISIPFYAELLEIPSPGGGGGESSGGGSEGEEGQGEGKKPAGEPPMSGKRTKYTCPVCGANLWGRKGLNIMCLTCDMKFVEMK